MQWEFLDIQELREASRPGSGHVYRIAMWRTPVPGGWLLITLNTRSNDPQPIQSFYPDAEHIWNGKTPPEAHYLLRAAEGASAADPSRLLRSSSSEETLLE